MAKVPGIFERPPDSGVHWISYFDIDGKRRREKAGKLTAALDLLAERRLQIKKGEFIPPRQTRAWTFKKLAEETIRRKALRLAPQTIETDTIRLKQLLPLIGHMRFDRLSPERIEETLAKLKESGLSNSTLNRYRSFISSVFSYALKVNLVSMNPVARVGRYRENDSRLRWLRPEEEELIRGALEVDTHRWEFDLALHTGMRRGEQFWLRWKDVDMERGNLTVKGKTGRRHIVANETAIAALRKLHMRSGDREFVCPDNDGRAKRDWRDWLFDAAKKAGVENFHWHDLRHTFASRLVMAGVDIRTVQELLGHKSIVQTMRYAHLSADHRKAAVAKMNVEAAVTP
ncbi:MAG: tyrosine-type recombinase/integrase [Acidobacteriia bacterium]|nr:tyrosine-type recombinase/integrase [Terriglobia bacterium]